MIELPSNLKQQVIQLAEITSGLQHVYYQSIADNSKPVKCVPLAEAFNEDELEQIYNYLYPQPKECYKNATKLAELFPNKVLYCEGLMDCYGLGIDHAWNKVGDVYVDITMELALKRKDEIKDTDYLLYAEYDFKTVNKVLYKNSYWGDIYKTVTLEKYKNKK